MSAEKYDLPFVQFVDGKGELTKETPYAGIFVKKADPGGGRIWGTGQAFRRAEVRA